VETAAANRSSTQTVGVLGFTVVKRAVREQQNLYHATEILIEDKASGTQLIQELIADGCHSVTRYQPDCEKIMRLHAQTAMIENGFVHIPEYTHAAPTPPVIKRPTDDGCVAVTG
jgi:predicted phage terminase large subunit-like protein